jgi:hypothetical protein
VVFPCSLPSIPRSERERNAVKRDRSRLVCARRNDSRELGVALALPCHQEARVAATK